MNERNCAAGFAKLDITPPLGVPMSGYYHVWRNVKGVLDPLFVRATAFREGDKCAVLMVVDNCEMEGVAGFEWPGRIAEKLGLPVEAVMVCCTHSHTTPANEGRREGFDPQYDAWLFRRLCDAAQMALDDCRPVVDVRSAEMDAGGLTYVRRYRMKDGSVVNNPPAKTWDEVAKIGGPLGHADTTMRLVRILRENAPELIYVNFQSHPDCVGGEYVSADFPGAVCRRVEEQKNCFCTFLNGAQGDLVVNDRTKPVGNIKDYAKAMAHGEEIADTALQMYDTAVSTNQNGLAVGQMFAHAKTKRDVSRGEEAAATVERFMKGGLEAVHPEKTMRGRVIADAFIIHKLEKLNADYLDLPVTALVFCGVALLGIPGEPFNAVGEQIRANSKFSTTCVCCLANGTYGYYPMASAYEEGGYEAGGAYVAKGGAELLIDTADKLLTSL